jgi:YD repeat-containing protein
MEVTPVSPTPWPNNFFNEGWIKYDTRVVKVTTQVHGDHQQQTVYTYDKYGRLESTVIHKNTIAEV